MGKKILGILGVLLCFLIGALAVVNCDRNKLPVNYDSVDTTCVCCDLQNTTLNIEDVYAFQQDLIEKQTVEFQFLNLQKPVIENVASVLHKRGVPLTMKTIVAEYLTNISVYDNLPPAEFADEEETDSGKLTTNSAGSSGMEDQRVTRDNKPQNTVSFHEQDTTIDGHKAKVLTRREVQYE